MADGGGSSGHTSPYRGRSCLHGGRSRAIADTSDRQAASGGCAGVSRSALLLLTLAAGRCRPIRRPVVPVLLSMRQGPILHRIVPLCGSGTLRAKLILVQTGLGMLRGGSSHALARHDARGLIGRLAMFLRSRRVTALRLLRISAAVRRNAPNGRGRSKLSQLLCVRSPMAAEPLAFGALVAAVPSILPGAGHGVEARGLENRVGFPRKARQGSSCAAGASAVVLQPNWKCLIRLERDGRSFAANLLTLLKTG